MNDGTGAFPQCATMGIGKISEDVALGDLNGDGTLDAVLANSGLPTLSQKNFVLLGAGGLGAVGVEPFGATQNRSSGVALGDVNQDGKLDVVFANSEALNTVCINGGNTAGQAGQPDEPSFTCSDISLSPAAAFPAWSAQNTTNDVALTDLNGDGVLDAIFANTGVNETCTGNGTGTFTCTGINVLTSRPSLNVTVGQLGSFPFSRNDRLDFVFANDAQEPNTRCLAWFTAGRFHCTDVDFDNNTSPRVGNNSSTGVAVGDLDGDGDGEMVFSNWLSENRVCDFSNVNGGTTCSDASTGTDRFTGVAASDGRSFQEDFNGTVITNLQDADNAYTVSGGQIQNTTSTDLGDRHYVRTHVTDYNTVDFVAELTFTLTDDTGNMLHFFGLGPGIPDTSSTDESTGAYLRIHSPGTASPPGRVDVFVRDIGSGSGIDSIQTIGQMTNSGGTHRARIEKSGDQVTFSIDVDFDGSVFAADFSHTITDLTAPTAAPFLNDTNSRIYFGTASGVDTFDDFKVAATVTEDTTAPVVTVPNAITEEATKPEGATVTFTASATDDLDETVTTASCTPASGSTFAITTTTVTCSATDAAGNTGTASFTVTVEDTTAPVFTAVPVNITEEAAGQSGTAVTFVPASATDLVDGSVNPTCAPDSGTTFAITTTTVTCSTTDSASPPNTSSVTFTVTVVDTTAPVLAAVPADITAEATSSSGAVVTFNTPAGTDLVDGSVAVSCLPASGSTFALGDATTVTCSATDSASPSNTGSATFTVTVVDTTPPVLAAVPADITAEAASSAGAVVNFSTPTATDAVDGAPAVTCVQASGSTFALGDPTTVTCSATDSASPPNTSSATFTVTVVDTTAPVLAAVPADITAEATSSAGAVVNFSTPTATDAVDGAPAVTCVQASGSTFALGDPTTVTCSATDSASPPNTSSATFTVTVVDTTAPVLAAVPADITAEATSSAGAVVNFSTPTATDAVDGAPAVTCVQASGSTFALGDPTTVTCSATDSASPPNTSSATFTVTVLDTTAPEFDFDTFPGFVVPERGPGGTPVDFEILATDTVDDAVIVTCTPQPNSLFTVGDTQVVCTATDDAGNSSQIGFTVTVLDRTPPVVSVPDNLTIGATGPGGATFTFTASATDTIDGPVTVTCVPPSGSTFPIDTTQVNCSADDLAGNTGTASFTVTVADLTPPVVSVPIVFTVEATSFGGTTVDFASSVTATDAVDGDLIASCTPPSGVQVGLDQSVPVTCIATDSSGNIGTGSFTMVVVDTTPPVFFPDPENIVIGETSAGGATVTYPFIATDAADPSPTSTCNPASGSTFAAGTTTVTCTVTDASGNGPTTAIFTVTVIGFDDQINNLSVDFKTIPSTARGGWLIGPSAHLDFAQRRLQLAVKFGLSNFGHRATIANLQSFQRAVRRLVSRNSISVVDGVRVIAAAQAIIDNMS